MQLQLTVRFPLHECLKCPCGEKVLRSHRKLVWGEYSDFHLPQKNWIDCSCTIEIPIPVKMPQICSTIIGLVNIFKLTLSPLSVESCCQTSKSKLSKVSSKIRSPEQTFFSFDAFFRPLIVAVVTVFSHLMLAPRTPPRASTTKNRLKNIFTIFFYVSLVFVTVDAFDLSDG